MKHYSDFFDWQYALAEPFIIAVLLSLTWFISGRMLLTKSAQLAAVSALVFLILMTKLAAFSGLLPYFPDTWGFARLVEESHVESSSLGVRLYFWVSAPLRLLAVGQIELYLIIQQFLFVISSLLIWQGWKIHCQHLSIPTGSVSVFLLLVVCYPSTLMFITVPLREFLMIFGFSLFLYGLAIFMHQGKLKWLLIGCLITILIRPQLVLLYPPMVLIAKQQNIAKLAFIGVLLLIAVIPVFELITGYHFSPEFFSLLRERGTGHYADSGMTYGAVTWKSYFDIILDLPGLLLQFVLSPLPILHNVSPLNLKTMLLDLFFVLLVLWGALSIQFRYSMPYLKMFLFASVLFSVWEFYIGGAVRHRMPLVLMLMPLAACYYSLLISKMLNVDDKNYAKSP